MLRLEQAPCRSESYNTPFLNHIAENPHPGFGLLFSEALVLQSLHELQRIEVMVATLASRDAEMALPLYSCGYRSMVMFAIRVAVSWLVAKGGAS